MRILGIDPGLNRTGWGVVEAAGHRLTFVACGVITTKPVEALPVRLAALDKGLSDILAQYAPMVAAVEETFVNKTNAQSALKLGQARGVCVVVPARAGLAVYEYAATVVKKAITGTGRAEKGQIALMVRTLLPTCGTMGADAADALAVAICHGLQGRR